MVHHSVGLHPLCLCNHFVMQNKYVIKWTAIIHSTMGILQGWLHENSGKFWTIDQILLFYSIPLCKELVICLILLRRKCVIGRGWGCSLLHSCINDSLSGIFMSLAVSSECRAPGCWWVMLRCTSLCLLNRAEDLLKQLCPKVAKI